MEALQTHQRLTVKSISIYSKKIIPIIDSIDVPKSLYSTLNYYYPRKILFHSPKINKKITNLLLWKA